MNHTGQPSKDGQEQVDQEINTEALVDDNAYRRQQDIQDNRKKTHRSRSITAFADSAISQSKSIGFVIGAF